MKTRPAQLIYNSIHVLSEMVHMRDNSNVLTIIYNEDTEIIWTCMYIAIDHLVSLRPV